jgi:hypothetical protein
MFKSNVAGFYSPIWTDKESGKGNKITSRTIKFEAGERLKFCPKCQDWHPSDTEFFSPAKNLRLGLSSWCKCCYREWKNEKRYWEKS